MKHPAKPRERWKSGLQFGLALTLVFGLSLAVDPVAERFKRRQMRNGWQRLRPPHETSALLLEGLRLWGGGRDGLSLFDWRHAALLPLPAGTPRLRQVRGLLLDRQGVLWVAHNSGVDRCAGGAWSHFDGAVGAAQALAQWRNGEIWVGGEKGLARLRDGAFRLERNSAALGFEGVDALLVDRNGDLWVSSAHPLRGGAARFAASGQWEDFTHASGLAHPSVASFFEDREGAVWFASGYGEHGGACRYKDGQWMTLRKRDGLASDRARLVYEDRTSRLWVSSETDGLAVRAGAVWRVLTPRQGMTGWEVKSVVETPDGSFWLATEDGVTRIPGDAPELNGGAAP